MGKRKSIVLFMIVALISCRESTTQLNNVTKSLQVDSSMKEITSPDTIKKVNYINKDLLQTEDSIFSCHELLLQLIKSSSFDPESKSLKFDVRIDKFIKGVATIELTIHNAERNEDVALSWLEIDVDKKQLRDITIDPDKPISLKYDSSLFRKLVENCKLQ